MSKKKNKQKDLSGETESVSAESNENLTEPVVTGEESSTFIPGSDTPLESGALSQDDPSNDKPKELSADDILDDVRRSLIDDESQALELQKQSKWWKRIGIGASKQEPKPEEPKPIEEIDIPDTVKLTDDDEIEDLKEELESEEYLDQIDELIDLLDEESDTAIQVSKVEEPPAEPEKKIDLDELKKQAFQPRVGADGTETFSEVRSIALEGEDEVFVEVESKPADPLDERIKAVENAFKPYRRYINFAIAFLGVVIAVIAAVIIYSVYQQSRPQPVVEDVESLPFPISVNLPGGWLFNLSKGSLIDGKWKPKGAEWLEGTEICRWVSLPYSRQLEAVLRTLNPDDPIELGMSNSDKLVYKVYSIHQMSMEEIQALDANSPCLLIILTENDAEKRWVLTALP
jgi:hypothetical protein